MGNCFKSPVSSYRKKNWKNALLEMESIDNYLSNGETFEPMKEYKGSGGFPFKTSKGRFIKIIMKNRRKTAFRVMMNLKIINKHCKNDNFLLLPETVVETKYAMHFHYKFCENDMISYLNTNKLTPNKRDYIFNHLLDAVIYMHSKGFVHKDIKLDNMVLMDGKPLLCDCDFSLRSNVRNFKGTRDYMPPQNVIDCLFDMRKDLSMDIKNKFMDCYALGKTFAKILSTKSSRDYEIKRMWDIWTDKPQISIRSHHFDMDEFILKSKWWKAVFWFCKYNEEYIFSKNKEYFWSAKKVKNML